jgi:hypothetical protein
MAPLIRKSASRMRNCCISSLRSFAWPVSNSLFRTAEIRFVGVAAQRAAALPLKVLIASCGVVSC